jgi:uncharacterized protein (TIGR03663 family)
MAVETLSQPHSVESSPAAPTPDPQRPPLLQRPLLRVNLEVVAYLVLVLLSIVAHIWGLGTMAMHHDESIHAWSSWNFYMGQGKFSCAGGRTSWLYCYDPIYHGPSLYILTFLSYFLFGDGDAQARLPMALAGIGLVASCWMLRPLIGKRGAFVAALLLGFSPSLLYFTRFARHDGLMVLWELWMVVGIFRYVQSGQVRYLYLLAASVALAVGTHELYYILFFIFGIFLLMRLLSERIPRLFLNIAIPAVLVVCVPLVLINPPLPVGQGLYLGDKALMAGGALLFAWLAHLVWPRSPLVISRFVGLWRTQRFSLWMAVAILVALYLVMYTTFFTYPPGALDGLYRGLEYWLGSQHEYARGDQPWYYYLMQLPLYEPLGVLATIGAAIYLFIYLPTRKMQPEEQESDLTPAPDSVATTARKPADNPRGEVVAEDGKRSWLLSSILRKWKQEGRQAPAASTPIAPETYEQGVQALVPLLLVFWAINAVIIFSWAGEKMPWLLVHMSLPANLVAAWALGKLWENLGNNAADTVGNGERGHRRVVLLGLVPPAVLLALIGFGAALWRFGLNAEGQEAQTNLLQGVVPLLVGGAMVFGLLTLAIAVGTRALLSMVGLTVAVVFGAYMLRSSWMAVYEHPDTPVELLVYTQTAPEIPRYVEDITELSTNMMRAHRTADEPTGSYSMPIIVDSGNKDGEGSLAWPLQWYFRHFTSVNWKKTEEFENPTRASFEVEFPDGSHGLAPVVMFYQKHITGELRNLLEEYYVRPYGESGSLNWWFPEGKKCLPDQPGYKRFYFSTWTSEERLHQDSPRGCGEEASPTEFNPPWAVFTWPLNPQNWGTLREFVFFRELPDSLSMNGRAVEVWFRSDIATGVAAETGETAAASGKGLIPLMAQQVFGEPGELNRPTGLAVSEGGRLYVADTTNHQVKIYDEDGTLERTIGEYGSGQNQFNEPRGIAVDSQGNIYVADTWNARVVKLSRSGRWVATWGTGEKDLGNGRMATITGGTQEANAATPLGFFGPRGIAVDEEGNVYVADTGNRRIVVTNSEGDYLYQWGYAGSEVGAFNEPTSLAIDSSGTVYVADTWNSRVQVFPTEADGTVSPLPVVQWPVSGWEPDTYEDPAIAVGPDGLVYVSVPTRQVVLAANMRGDILFRWGGAGDDMASLNLPSGVAVDSNGYVYVGDRSSDRVLRFEMPQVRQSGE